jgi:hypothetical protein
MAIPLTHIRAALNQILSKREKGAKAVWRREPLEERRDGLVENHTCIYFTAIGKLQKRIHDTHPIKHLAVMHVLTKKYATARTLRTTKMERIKIRESVQAMHINSGKNIRNREFYQWKPCIKLDLAARNLGIQTQLPDGSRKILPQHWNGNHGSLLANMRFYKVCRNRLLA